MGKFSVVSLVCSELLRIVSCTFTQDLQLFHPLEALGHPHSYISVVFPSFFGGGAPRGSQSKFVPILNQKNLILIPFCGAKECEGNIKDDSATASLAEDEEADDKAPSMGAKSLCIPFDHQDKLKAGMMCIHPACGQPATCICMFGRSY